MNRNVKVIGERNCGTNLLEQLLEVNLRIALLKFTPNSFQRFLLKSIHYDFVQDLIHDSRKFHDLGWKHGIPETRVIHSFDPQELAIVSITKNPYTFLLSLYRRPYHFKGTLAPTFVEFIRQPWVTRKRDNTPERVLTSPVALWNTKNAAYLELRAQFPEIVYPITYEELMSDPVLILDQLCDAFHLSKKQDVPVLIESSTKGDDLSFSDYQSYYLKEVWKKELTKEAIIEINQRLDLAVLSQFNYPLLDPTSF